MVGSKVWDTRVNPGGGWTKTGEISEIVRWWWAERTVDRVGPHATVRLLLALSLVGGRVETKEMIDGQGAEF